MARTPSKMTRLADPAAPFSLPEPATGNQVCLSDFAQRPLLVAFICNHCPYVQNMRSALAAFGQEYQKKGLAMVAINSNDAANYPEDSPENMVQEVRQYGYSFPYLFDESQQIAHAYEARCTPDFFLFNADKILVYRGQFDDSRPQNDISPSGSDMRRAADMVLAGKAVEMEQKPSLGCNIKWQPGNAPAL